MNKRTIALVVVLTVFALSLLGAQVLAMSSFAPDLDHGQASLIDNAPGIILASDEPVCPPSVPAPCG